MSSPKSLQDHRIGNCRLPDRRGVVAVLLTILLPVMFAFVALAVDMNLANYEQTEVQNGVDAAALAAAQRIVSDIEASALSGGTEADVNSISVEAARQTAAKVAALNGVEIDPALDVTFGKSIFDEETQKWNIQWGVEPYNVVRVQAIRNRENGLIFGKNWGLFLSGNSGGDPIDGETQTSDAGTDIDRSLLVSAEATAFVESRDIVLVMDFSRSMNYDSCLGVSRLSKADVLDNEWEIYESLGSPDLGPIITPQTSADIDKANYYKESSNGDDGFAVETTFRYDQVDVKANRPFKKVVVYYYNKYGSTYTKTLYPNTSEATFKSTDYNSTGRRIHKVKVYEKNNSSPVSIADWDAKDGGSIDEKAEYFGLAGQAVALSTRKLGRFPEVLPL